jgi:hypothetical protein
VLQAVAVSAMTPMPSVMINLRSIVRSFLLDSSEQTEG